MAENASKYGIMRMGIFGSVARDEQTVESDVDVYVEIAKRPACLVSSHQKKSFNTVWLRGGYRKDCVKDMDGILRLNIMEEGIYA